MLRADIKVEKEVADGYDRAARQVAEVNPEQLLLRIREHEVYHTDIFNNLLKEQEQQR